MNNYNNESDYNNQSDNSLTNLIVNYLPQNFSDQELYGMFITIGPVVNCRVMRDRKTGYSYGFGFVNYSKKDDAAKAILQLNGLEIQNKKLKVSYARPPGDEIKDTNLYISNLPSHTTEDGLEMLFGKFGKIVQRKILIDKLSGLPKGNAFVRYDKKSEAAACLREMNGFKIDGTLAPLYVRLAEEHGKQKAAYYAGFQAGFGQFGVTPRRAGPRMGYSGPVANFIPTIPPYPRDALPRSAKNYNDTFYGGPLRQDRNNYRYNPVGFSRAPSINDYY